MRRRMIRLLAAVFAVVLLLGSVGAVERAFSDVPVTAYYAAPVSWAAEKGITNGTDATRFSPNAPCTRGQIVTFLWRASGSPEPEQAENGFTDIAEGDYYYKAVLWAVENGVTNGTAADRFSPGAACTRAQAVTFLYRAQQPPEVQETATNFADVQPEAYYAPAVGWAVQAGVTKGVSQTAFAPERTCTRAQIVTFLYRTLVGPEPEPVKHAVTALGDSVMLGAKPALESAIPGIVVDATESRQVWHAKEALQKLEEEGKLGDTVIIALGTNSRFNETTGQEVIDYLGPNRTIYWVTAYGANLSWQEVSNATIRTLAAKNPNVTLIEWDKYAPGHEDWFWSDGLHLRPAGQQAYAQFVAKAIGI